LQSLLYWPSVTGAVFCYNVGRSLFYFKTHALQGTTFCYKPITQTALVTDGHPQRKTQRIASLLITD